MPLVEARDIDVRFGGLLALSGVGLEMYADEIVGVIGPNGAGKTTLFNVLSGLLAPTSGHISFDGVSITGLPPHRRAKLGISRTFQRVQLFRGLSVADNVLVGVEATRSLAPLSSLLRTRRYVRSERLARTKADAVLELVGLSEIRDRPAGTLPLGLQRRTELARALAQSPRLLLLDEPASGLDESESADFCDVVAHVRGELGLSVLIVEHDMAVVNRICDQLYVLDFGRIIAAGEPRDVINDPAVVAAYLGEEDGLKESEHELELAEAEVQADV